MRALSGTDAHNIRQQQVRFSCSAPGRKKTGITLFFLLRPWTAERGYRGARLRLSASQLWEMSQDGCVHQFSQFAHTCLFAYHPYLVVVKRMPLLMLV